MNRIAPSSTSGRSPISSPQFLASTEIWPHVHTIELWFPPHLRKQQYWAIIKAKAGQRLEPYLWRKQLCGYRLICNAPTPAQLYKQDELCRKFNGTLSRFDAAYEMQAVDPPALRAFIVKYLVVKWGRQTALVEVGEDDSITVYWGRHRRHSRRKLLLYSDDANKITGEVHAVHLELRFLRPAAVRAQGIHRPSDLLDLDPQALFMKHMSFMDLDRALRTKIRTLYNQERRKWKAAASHPVTDRWRAQLPKRIRRLLTEQLGFDRAQNLRQQQPKLTLQKLSNPLTIPTQMTWKEEVVASQQHRLAA